MGAEFDKSEIIQLFEDALNIAKIVSELASLDFWGNVKSETPVDHGRLQGSWDLDKIADLQYQIYTNVEYALAVHDGSKAHWIQGKAGASYMGSQITRGGMLYWPGAKHPVWRVRHPGTKGNPFTIPAFKTTEARMGDFTNTALKRTGVS